MRTWYFLAPIAGVLASAAIAAVPFPTVTGPIAVTAAPGDPSRNYPFFATQFDLAARGYVEEEFFLSGTANRYNTTLTSTTTAVILDGGHPYKTRLIVRRPASSAGFNGVAIVEWINVTNGFDAENTWFQIHEHVLRSGYAWVGVSAQRAGVNALRTWSPSRYGTLDVSQRNANLETITDDSLSYDILSQAVQALRARVGADPLGGLAPQLVLATGHSGSAVRLAAYANSIDPLAGVVDAFALHSSTGQIMGTDLRVPVWKMLAEYDVVREAAVRRPDDAFLSTWEVAGASHVDSESWLSRVFLQLRDRGSALELALACAHMPPGSEVPFRYPFAAGLDHLVGWARDGIPMPPSPRIEVIPGSPATIVRNALGLAMGGIQLSEIAVPIAQSVGTGVGPLGCVPYGYSEPFDDETLETLYPTHGAYVSRVAQVTHRNLENGFINPVDALTTIHEAVHGAIGGARKNRLRDPH